MKKQISRWLIATLLMVSAALAASAQCDQYVDDPNPPNVELSEQLIIASLSTPGFTANNFQQINYEESGGILHLGVEVEEPTNDGYTKYTFIVDNMKYIGYSKGYSTHSINLVNVTLDKGFYLRNKTQTKL